MPGSRISLGSGRAEPGKNCLEQCLICPILTRLPPLETCRAIGSAGIIRLASDVWIERIRGRREWPRMDLVHRRLSKYPVGRDDLRDARERASRSRGGEPNSSPTGLRLKSQEIDCGTMFRPAATLVLRLLGAGRFSCCVSRTPAMDFEPHLMFPN